jgi:hypothetical protein
MLSIDSVSSPTLVVRMEPSTNADRASAVQSDLSGVSNASRGALRIALDGLASVGKNIRAAFVSLGNVLTGCFRPVGSEGDGAQARGASAVHVPSHSLERTSEMKKPNGMEYARANLIETNCNELVGCAYPRTEDLPQYFAMVKKNRAEGINVMLVDESAENNTNYPRYFAENGRGGAYSVPSGRIGTCRVGQRSVDTYDLKITDRETGQVFQARARHSTDWSDFAALTPNEMRELESRVTTGAQR